jgi:hypothetical protein
MALYEGAGEEIPKTVNQVANLFFIRTIRAPFIYFYIKSTEGDEQIIGAKKNFDGAGMWTEEQANIFLDKFKFRDSFEMVRVSELVAPDASGN